MCMRNLNFVTLPVPEIIGVPEKIGQPLDTPTLPFLQNFSWAFVRMDPDIVLAKFDVRSFTPSWDNSDWSFGWGANPNLGEEEAIGGREWCRWKERWWVPIGPHSNFSCTRFRDIADFVLQNAIFSHPTSTLPKIFLCSPGRRWMAFGLRRAKVLG